MAYELTFTHRFHVPDRKLYINDCCYAGDLIAERLLPVAKRGEHRDLDTGQEDWGWYIWFRAGELRMTIDIHCHDVDAGSFAIHVGASRPRFLRRDLPVDCAELKVLRERVHAELRAWLDVEVKTQPIDLPPM